MEDYKFMYYALFNSVTDVIESLKMAQQATENMFINGDSKSVLSARRTPLSEAEYAQEPNKRDA